MLELIKDLKIEVEVMLRNGKTLKEIRNWSYKERESGRNIPYLAKDGEFIFANPVKGQKDLYSFFNEKADGCRILKRYSFTVGYDGVELIKRISKKEFINL